MWIYSQAAGRLSREEYGASAYSGHLEGLNNPALQGDADIGPIPQGEWVIGAPRAMPRLGPEAMPLTPKPGTQTFGRSGFWMHGDFAGDGAEMASHGCIVCERTIRNTVALSGDTDLKVIP